MIHDFRKDMIVVIAISMIPTAALAHARLQKAEPRVGGTVTASPSEIRIEYSEGVEPNFSGINLATIDGTAVPVGKPAIDPQNQAVLIVKVDKKLAPGAYKVNWHVVAVDTYRTEGSFTFSVQ